MERCGNHRYEEVVGTCRTCQGQFCESCLVFAYGRWKAPYCMTCALIAVGTTPSESWLEATGIGA
jgi:hypothetical protein